MEKNNNFENKLIIMQRKERKGKRSKEK